MKLISWNINGLRACARKGFWDYFQKEAPDVLCLQETKITAAQLGSELEKIPNHGLCDLRPAAGTNVGLFAPKHEKGCYCLLDAKKPGYSGVLMISKVRPKHVDTGLGILKFDNEGRTLIAHFDDFILVNSYFPNAQRDLGRMPFKLAYNEALLTHLQKLRGRQRHIVICGDMNVAHTEIDIKNAKSNQNNSGFTQVERDWFTKFLSHDYVDTFRHLHPDARDCYTWWSNRPGVRERNIGWRIDYFVVTREMLPRVKEAFIRHEVPGSDHCPVGIEIICPTTV